MEGNKHIITNGHMIAQILQSVREPAAMIEQTESGFEYTFMNNLMEEYLKGYRGKSLTEVHMEEAMMQIKEVCNRADREGEVEDYLPSLYSEPFRLQKLETERLYLLYLKEAGQDQHYESMIEASPDAIFVHDEGHKLVFVNQAAVTLLGASKKEELLGLRVDTLIQDESPEDVLERLEQIFTQDLVIADPFERKVRQLNGNEVDIEIHGSKVTFQGKPAIQSICRSIHYRVIRQNKLKELAYQDQLTNISNRRSFFKQLERHLELAMKKDERCALLFIDMDHFKEMNDQYGHPIGDEILIIFTKRLQHLLRRGDVLARMGGDEFVILLTDLQAPSDAAMVADRLVNHVSKPVMIHGHTITISVSIGIALFPDHGEDKDRLLANADQALYEAKRNGRKCVRIHTGV